METFSKNSERKNWKLVSRRKIFDEWMNNRRILSPPFITIRTDWGLNLWKIKNSEAEANFPGSN